MGDHLIEVNNLVKHFPLKGGFMGKVQARVHAVDGVSLKVDKGKTLGLVGESGCGKSTLGRTILRLYEPDSGEIKFDGFDMTHVRGEELRMLRRKMQIIFQDPYASLNPRMTVEEIVSEPLLVHRVGSRSERRDRVYELLDLVGLNKSQARNYSHEFSGGQRQRIGIARAIALNPDFIVADEPVSALDVSIQGEIINLLAMLQDKLKLSYLFIAHDLKVVIQMSHDISVMYLGFIVERFKGDRLGSARHPYTQALVSAVPVPDVTGAGSRMVLKGDVPSPVAPPSGCRFHPRCPYKKDLCSEQIPELRIVGGDHEVACHFAEDMKLMEDIGY